MAAPPGNTDRKAGRLSGHLQLAILTLPGYEMNTCLAVIDALRDTSVSRGQAIAWHLASLRGGKVVAENGLSLRPTVRLRLPVSALLVLSAPRPGASAVRDLRRSVLEAARLGTAIGMAGDTIGWLGRAESSDVIAETQATAPELALTLITKLGDRNCGSAASSARRVASDDVRLERALAVIERDLAQPLQTAHIAAASDLSLRQLERLFRRHLKSSPAAYVIRRRLERARSLLRGTTVPIGEIAMRCGFRSPAHFSSSYRGRFGHSPRHERQPAA